MSVLMNGFLFAIRRGEDGLDVPNTHELPVEEEKGAELAGLKRSTNAAKKTAGPLKGKYKNHVREIRESLLMSKAELARKAGLSVLTVGRIENGVDCRMDTKRKIILALGLTLADKEKVFPEDQTSK